MPFDSKKQQEWYYATDQDFFDDEPASSRKVKGNDNFVQNEIARFGENSGDSSDKFYDKIFEALEKEELTCEDCGKKLGTNEPMDFAPSMSIRCPECQEDFSRHASYNDETGEWTYG